MSVGEKGRLVVDGQNYHFADWYRQRSEHLTTASCRAERSCSVSCLFKAIFVEAAAAKVANKLLTTSRVEPHSLIPSPNGVNDRRMTGSRAEMERKRTQNDLFHGCRDVRVAVWNRLFCYVVVVEVGVASLDTQHKSA